MMSSYSSSLTGGATELTKCSGIPANIVMANRLFNVELKLFELQSTVNESKKEVIRNVSSLIT